MKHCHLQITNQLAELKKIETTLEQFFQRYQLCQQLANEMILVAEELVVNTISYGYSDDLKHTIAIEITLDQQVFSMTLTDDAMPFNPLSQPPPCADKEVAGGHGIPLVRALCDQYSYQHRDGCNIFSLSKLIV